MRIYSDNKMPSYSPREKNASYFTRIACEECRSSKNLQQHKYNDEILCDSCVDEINFQLRAAEEKEIEEYNNNFNQLQSEREG